MMKLDASWQWTELGELGDAIRGVTFAGGEGVPNPLPDTIACLTTSGVQEEVNWESRRFIPIARVANQKQLLQEGDLLISTANSKELVGKSCLVKNIPYPCTFGAFVTVFRPNEKTEPNLLAYWMRTTEFLRFCYQASSNTTNISNLRTTELLELKIPLPPLPEQRRIAALLDKADHLRRTRRYAAQLSDTFLQAVFVRMFGDPVRNPMGWQLERLAEVLELPPQYGLYVPPESYSSDPKEGIEMVHMSDLFYGVVERGLLKRVKSDVAGLEAYHIDDSDLLIARRSLNYEGAAKPCRIPKYDEPLLFESSMLRIRPNRKKMHPIYLYHYLADERARIAHVQKFVTRSTISGINQSNLCDVEVLCPPLALQQKFTRIVQQFERLRAQQREAERQAEHLFQTLLHRAFA